MGINHWEWEGMGLKKIFPLISSRKGRRSFVNSGAYAIVRTTLL